MARKKCKRTKAVWEGVTIALPCGSKKLSTAHKDVIDATVTDGEWSSAKGKKCRGVFYNANSFALRCDRNRAKVSARPHTKRAPAGNPKGAKKSRPMRLAAIRKTKRASITKKGGSERTAETRYKRMRRAGAVCRKGSGKNKKFASRGCRPGA